MNRKKLIIFLIISLIFCFPACKKTEKEMLVTTGAVSNILTTTADITGDILDLGEGATKYGHCYSTSPNAKISGSKTDFDDPSIGGFTSALTSLTPGTKYYIKAYLSRGTVVVYGSEINFTTASADLPELTTSVVSGITKTGAVSGGNITSQGGTPVTTRGVCWSTATITALTINKTTNGSGTGSFSSEISGLSAGTTYYVRAYATNSGGTKLGNEVSFSTTPDTPVPPTVTTASVTGITSNSAVCGGEVTNEGSASVTLKGVSYNTSANPTILNSTTNNGAGPGSFVSSITGLDPGTKYYVRAYATSSAGTTYGTENNFTTSAVVPTLTTVPITNITSTTASSGGAITNSGGAPVIGKGVCWKTSSGPTITDPKTDDGIGTVSYVSSLTSLSQGTKYYVKAYATNSAGTGYGDEYVFTTATAPIVKTLASTGINNTFATLHGTVIANQSAATVTFEYEKYGTTGFISIPAVPGTVNGLTETNISATLTGLVSGAAYSIRVKAVNTYGTSTGENSLLETTIKDPDGNIYTPITVSGGTVWMKENLKTTKYADGTPIPKKLTTVLYPDVPGYGWYNNDSMTYKNTYGALYNYGAVRYGGHQLCPDGWHVPGQEWITLINSAGGNAWGGKLKETGTVHWLSPNTGATNFANFTALPGGEWNIWYNYEGLGILGAWWTMTTDILDNPIYILIYYDDVLMYTSPADSYIKLSGFSVRCIRD
jgi:uncharacterized protein (TIGR02145 family)